MSDLVPIDPAGAITNIRVELAARVAMDEIRDGFTHVLSAADLDDARKMFAAFARQCALRAAQRPGVVSLWMERVAAGMAFQMSDDALQLLVMRVLQVSGDLPVAAFSDATDVKAGRTLRRLSAADVDAVVRPAGIALLARRNALERVIKVAEQAQHARAAEPTEPSDDQRAATLADFQAKMAVERQRPNAVVVKTALPSVTLTLAQLLAVAERTILSGKEPHASMARNRAESIRAAMETAAKTQNAGETRDGCET